MKPFLPKSYEPYAFGLLLSGLMSFIVSGLSTFLAVRSLDGFLGLWLGAWLPSWLIAFPSVLIVAPIVRRILKRMIIT